MNSISLIGRLVAEPELVYLPTGTPKVTFRVAVQRPLKKEQRGNEHVQQADFITVRAFKRTAEIVAEHSHKGRQIGIVGAMRIDQYDTQDRGRQYFTYVVANQVDPFLDGKRESAGETQDAGAEAAAPDREEREAVGAAASAAAAETDEPW